MREPRVRCAVLALSVLSVVGCNAILGIDDHDLTPNAVPGASTDVTGDAGAEAGPPGCFSGIPSTDTDFFNRCTTAEYAGFDNCARIHLCSTTQAPALVPPPALTTDAGTSATATPPAALCYDASARSKLLFMQGSTNFTPFVQAMAPLVSKNGYVIVWQPTASCLGAGAGGFDTTPGANLMTNPTTASGTYASFYDATGTGTPCLLGSSPRSPDGVSEITDIGESDVFAESCPAPSGQQAWDPGSASYPDVGHYLGPIQAMVFVVPAASTQEVISAEAARMVFGIGGDSGMAPPWSVPARMFIRGPGTGTNIILSRAIGVPSGQWWGIDTVTASAMQTAIVTSSASDAEKTIGTLSVDYADKVKNGIHVLYFQASGQLAGFLPDSTPNTSDKQNVRDGHYSPWGPIHLYTRLVAGQTSAQAAAFILPFTVPNQALIDATIAGGAVPVCAMRVSRNQEMGPLQAFSPSFQCDCYYDAKVSGATSCLACTGSGTCPASRPACNLGYCEAD